MWRRILILLILLSLLPPLGCGRRGKRGLKPNQVPETKIVNVPCENTDSTSYFALIKVSWIGWDNDGYVVGYYYRWNTYHLSRGDSIIREFKYTEATSDTIAFESSDSINLQIFEVKAVDNEGAVDPTPAHRRFYTTQVAPPQTEILIPADGAELFLLDHPTSSWPGISLKFRGSDPDGEITGYSWRVDDLPWSEWGRDTSVTINPLYFGGPGDHTISVKSRDNTAVEDPTPAVVNIKLVKPTFGKGILVLDETKDGSGDWESPTDAQVDSFYQRVIEREFDSWDYTDQGLPPKEMLGDYRLLIWHSDDKTDPNVGRNQEYVADYLMVGGKLWLGGWKVLSSFGNPDFPLQYGYGEFPHDFLHLLDANLSDKNDFLGAQGVGGFSSVEVDSSKLLPFRHGRLYEVNCFTPGTFAEPILTFNSASQNMDFQGKPCAIKYAGTDYRLVFLGFPLYYIKQEDASLLAEEILNFLGE